MFFDELKGFEIPEDKVIGHSLRPQQINCWVGAAITAASALVSGLMSKDKGGSVDGKIRPKTVSGNAQTSFDNLFNEQAEQAMRDMAEQLNSFGTEDRDFFKNVFQPFQQSLIQSNQRMLPMIEKVAASALEANTRDMVSMEPLKASFAKTAQEGFEKGGKVEQMSSKFFEELENMPSEQEMIGQALAGVEGQFQGAGKELARDFAQRGQMVSQASKRDLAMQKAQAKAGAAGAASTQFRNESLTRAEAGLGAATGLAETESALKSQAATGMLALQGRQDQAALTGMQLMHQVGEVGTGENLLEGSAELKSADAMKQVGGETTESSTEWTQKGIKGAVTQNEDGTVTVGGKVMNSSEYNELMNQITKLKNRPQGGGGMPNGGWGGGPGVGGADGPGTGGMSGGGSGASVGGPDSAGVAY